MTRLPRLETERLILRPHRAEDLEAYSATWADPKVLTHFSSPPSPDEAWSRLLRVAGLWTALGYGYFVAVEKGTGRYAGEVGFADFKRDLDPAQPPDPEAGWVFASWTHGKGIAGEAARAVHDWMDATHAPGRLWCMIAPANAPSLRLADRLGYRRVGTVRFGGEAQALLERRKP